MTFLEYVVAALSLSCDIVVLRKVFISFNIEKLYPVLISSSSVHFAACAGITLNSFTSCQLPTENLVVISDIIVPNNGRKLV